MHESKHTPGPWSVDPDDREGMEWNIHIVAKDDRDMRICFMASNGPVEANAHLIAAAPDMLAILQRIAVSYPGYIPDFIEGVYAVIDKATGE